METSERRKESCRVTVTVMPSHTGVGGLGALGLSGSPLLPACSTVTTLKMVHSPPLTVTLSSTAQLQ